jgi:hypothetical protein
MRQIKMKKIICISFLLLSSINALYAANKKNITINIQGTGPKDTVEGFKYALVIEATAAGYDITENTAMAKYSIKFTVEWDQIEERSKFTVSLVKVEDSYVVVTMEYFFADEEEMLLYSQLVFFMLMANLPEDEIIIAVAGPEDDSWRHKWLYARASFEYLVLLLQLMPKDNLIGGAGVYDGSFENPTSVAPLDNKLIPMPGLKLGLEVQFLDFMSVEPGAQISMEQIMLNEIVYNVLFSLQIKFPLKFIKSLVLEPYGAGAYPMRFPQNKVFEGFPLYSYGGGIQISAKAGKNGAAFVDISYMYFGEVDMKNYIDKLYPNPKTITFNHSILGFSIGYKYGFIDRKR